MIYLSLLALAALAPSPAHAADKVLNGGDACERRFTEVRDDLAAWIKNGGAKGISLPKGLAESTYSSTMGALIQGASVACTDQDLRVGATEKVCLNEKDASGNGRITCQRQAFLALSQDEQYRLAHHEYAGLAGFEKSDGEKSSYYISNQIVVHLDAQIVKRLAVKGALGGEAAIAHHFQDFYGEYSVEACSTSTNIPADKNLEPDLCNLTRVEIKPGKFGPDQYAVYLNFLESKAPMFGAGSVVARTGICQLGYGSGNCSSEFDTGQDPVPGVQPRHISYTSRIENVGAATFLDQNVKFVDASGYFRKWSLVLRKVVK